MIRKSMFLVVCLLAFQLFCGEIKNIPVSELGKEYQLTGKLNVHLGQDTEIEGILINGPIKGSEGGANLLVQRINGKTIQEFTRICIRPFLYGWKELSINDSSYYVNHDKEKIKPVTPGKTYKLNGYETGRYIGVPWEIYKKAGIMFQTSGFYFRQEFIFYKFQEIKPIIFTPADFEGRRAMLQGKAENVKNQAVIKGKNWVVIVNEKSKWPKDIVGKEIETNGMYNPVSENYSDKTYRLVDGNWHLVKLKDQVGKKVELRGKAWSLNRIWWFNYRGNKLYVENMNDMPGWSVYNHGRPMVVKGILEKAKRPSLDQISLKPDRDLKECYIIRKPTYSPIPTLFNHEEKVDTNPPCGDIEL